MCGRAYEDVSKVDEMKGNKIIMVYELKCKNCGKMQKVTIEELEKECFYKCKGCGTQLARYDEEILKKIECFESFELLSVTLNMKKQKNLIDNIFDSDLEHIKELYYESDSDKKKKVSNIIDLVYLIIRGEEMERVDALHERVTQLFSQSIEERNKKMNEILGIEDDSDFI